MIDEIYKKVESKLKDHPSRLKHTLGVLEVAVELAKIYSVDTESASIAALYHDYTKYDEIHDQIKDLDPKDIEDYRQFPIMYHALSAEKKLMQDFGITDSDILNAIRYHIWGRPRMSVLEKIIFIADYVEPNRHMEDITEIRNIAKTDLNRAVYRIMASSNAFLIQKGIKPSPLQLQATHYYEEVTRGKTKHNHSNT